MDNIARGNGRADRCAGARQVYRALPALALVLLSGSLLTTRVAAAPPLLGDLQALLDHADRHSAQLRASAAEQQAAERRVDRAGALDDPMLRIEADDLFGDGPAWAPARAGSVRLEWMQPLPWPGKRALRVDIASAQADRSRAERARVRSQVHREIRIAHADWLQAERTLQLLDELAGLLHDAEAVARSRYAAGLAPQADVLRAQLELTTLAGERIDARTAARAAAARLNGLTGRDGGDLLPPVDDPIEPLPPLADAEARLMSTPETRAAVAFERAAERQQALSRRERWPDLGVGVMAMQQGSSVDEWGVMIELNLPLRSTRRRAEQAEAAALRDAAQALRQHAGITVLAGLRATHAEASGALQRLELVAGTLEPQAALTLDAARAAYASGTGPFLAVLDAARQLRDARRSNLQAAAAYRRQLAEFLDLLGDA